ncbi:MAG: peptidylprolyl isomerase [Fibrobacter sp.]|nr:peptidylprolyl isomerase [Fibrobacter sp.]
MSIAENTKVAIHYTLKDDEGKIIDSSAGKEPLNYVHGQGMIVQGLEKALTGKNVGDKFSVDVAPAEGYGEYNPELVRALPKSAFQADEIKPGMVFYAQTPAGIMPLTVSKVEGDNVMIDMNHELAGKTLHFEIEVMQADAMTEEEIKEMNESHHCCCHGEGEECEDGEHCCCHDDDEEGGEHQCCGGKHHDDPNHECKCKNKNKEN